MDVLEKSLRVIDVYLLQDMKVVARQTFESSEESSEKKNSRRGPVKHCIRNDETCDG